MIEQAGKKYPEFDPSKIAFIFTFLEYALFSDRENKGIKATLKKLPLFLIESYGKLALPFAKSVNLDNNEDVFDLLLLYAEKGRLNVKDQDRLRVNTMTYPKITESLKAIING